MAKSKKTVTLRATKNDKNHEFGFEHALKLLRLQETNIKKGWEISDKNYTFENGEIIKNRVNRKSKEADE